MMIDFALEANAWSTNPRGSDLPGVPARFRPIMMTTMAALLGGCLWRSEPEPARSCGIRWYHDCRRLAGEPVAFSLHHPVVYLWFDRLAQRFSHLKYCNAIEEPGGVSVD